MLVGRQFPIEKNVADEGLAFTYDVPARERCSIVPDQRKCQASRRHEPQDLDEGNTTVHPQTPYKRGTGVAGPIHGVDRPNDPARHLRFASLDDRGATVRLSIWVPITSQMETGYPTLPENRTRIRPSIYYTATPITETTYGGEGDRKSRIASHAGCEYGLVSCETNEQIPSSLELVLSKVVSNLSMCIGLTQYLVQLGLY
ncbi:hypothetical protein EDB83DRAFT_2314031 [Lactarius deliciosus]|nr:hypothetical protein EDB83DRAFT_2314031 [Lactarius deliciosus]